MKEWNQIIWKKKKEHREEDEEEEESTDLLVDDAVTAFCASGASREIKWNLRIYDAVTASFVALELSEA